MTEKQILKMSEEERREFMNVTCMSFDKNMSLQDYTDAIRAHIYIWRRLMEGRKVYTFESISERVKVQAAIIKQYYDAQAPVDDTAVDVDYACG